MKRLSHMGAAGRISMVVLMLLLGTVQQTAAGETLRIGLLPEMNVFRQMQRFQPLAEYLSGRLGTKVELVMLSRYGNIVERFRQEAVDAAFLGSFTGAYCMTRLGVQPLARPVNLDGTTTYYGHIFVRRDSGIKEIADLRGKRLALVEKATTAGYFFPLAYFRRHGVQELTSSFSELYFIGSHDGTIEAVASGQADVGAAKNTIFERVLQRRPELKEQLLILADSPRVPSNGLFARPDLPTALKQRLKAELLSLHEGPAGVDVLRKLGMVRFTECKCEDYQTVLDIVQEAGVTIDAYDYRNL